MALAAHGHLGEVRYDDHLVRFRQVGQYGGQRHRNRAAHASIDLVEHERVARVGLAKHDLTCEHHAAHLAARGNAGKRAWRHACASAIHEFDLRSPRARPLRALKGFDMHDELGAAHLQAGHLCVRLLAEFRGGCFARVVERLGGLGEFRLGGGVGGFGLGNYARGIVDRLDELGRSIATLNNVFHTRPKGAHKALQGACALLQALQGMRVVVDAVAVLTQIARCVFENIGSVGERRNQGFKRGVGRRERFERGDGRIHGLNRASVA